MNTVARMSVEPGPFFRWALVASVAAVGFVGSGCRECDHALEIEGDLAIAYEPERVLTIRLCKNEICETDEVQGAPSRTDEYTSFCVNFSASTRFTNTVEERHIAIWFGGAYTPSDDFSVDIWLEDGTLILNLVLPDIDRTECGPIIAEF